MVAEIMGKATGMCGGKGGSMHVADFSVGMLGANGIVGGGSGIAAGAAFSAKSGAPIRWRLLLRRRRVNKGKFHEALNWAAVWNLPVDVRLREQQLRAVHRS